MDKNNDGSERESGQNSPLTKAYSVEAVTTEQTAGDDEFEVFKRHEGQVDYRTVRWLKATLIFLKRKYHCLAPHQTLTGFVVVFATGVLSIPAALYTLGAVPGNINIFGWCILNTYAGVIFGNFRNRHAGCHSVADMAGIVGGAWMRGSRCVVRHGLGHLCLIWYHWSFDRAERTVHTCIVYQLVFLDRDHHCGHSRKHA